MLDRGRYVVEAGVLQPGSVIRNRNRLWRVDEIDKDVLVATSIDGGETEHHSFYMPFEDIVAAKVDFPSPDRIGL